MPKFCVILQLKKKKLGLTFEILNFNCIRSKNKHLSKMITYFCKYLTVTLCDAY